jgi:multidrug efflux pump subunit AcrA (membrane-fusion protein)
VYVVRGGELAKVPVTTGISGARSVEVVSGLGDEEEVVTSISPALTEGGKVRAVMAGASGPQDVS